jgi:hypothetical protein
LREYVAQLIAEASSTGMPMLRPMFLQWPNDAGCQGPDVEDQFMFGATWLVAPVYVYQATNRSVYLPALDANHTWIYFYSMASYGQGGSRVTVPTPIDEFPVFFIQPVVPSPPLVYANATNFFSAERNDTVLCVTSSCYSANAPGQSGDYVTQRSEAIALLNDPGTGSAVINGTSYPTVSLVLYYSPVHSDNLVTTNASQVPDASYQQANGGTVFENGYVLATQAPGTVPLQVWFKQFSSGPDANWDYATVASPAGLAWVQSNGYTFTGQIAGYAFVTTS